jgi:hypothetical protein
MMTTREEAFYRRSPWARHHVTVPASDTVTWPTPMPRQCAVCGKPIEAAAPLVDTGPTDWLHDPSAPRRSRYIPAGTDIHGWTPFETSHPPCFASVHGDHELAELMAEADRRREG